jgi:hypothetical protein
MSSRKKGRFNISTCTKGRHRDIFRKSGQSQIFTGKEGRLRDIYKQKGQPQRYLQTKRAVPVDFLSGKDSKFKRIY